MKIFWRCLEAWAVLMLLSLILYAFAGLHFWAPLAVNEYGSTEKARGMLLTLLHVVPIIAAIAHRVAQSEQGP